MKSKLIYKIKKHISICDYEKLWMKLTIGCVIAVIIIIKECTYPIFTDNKLLVSICCSDINGDKTFYNIAISYIAAYIFYLFQVYYPERSKTNRVLSMTALDAFNFINQVNRFVFMWDNIAETTSDGAVTSIKNEDFYYKGKKNGNISKANIKEICLTSQRVIEEYNKIVMSPEFQFVDLSIYKLFKDYDFEKEIKKFYMRLIGADIASKTSANIFETYSRDELNSINVRMNLLSWLYGFEDIESYVLVSDKKMILKWEEEQNKLYEHWKKNKEFFENLPQDYIETLK